MSTTTMDMSSMQKALSCLGNDETTTPKKARNKPLYLCKPFVSASLVQGKFKNLCNVPAYIEPNEWIARCLIDLYTQLNSFISVISTACTAESCPEMSVSADFNVYWRDARERPAFTYIDSTLSWIQSLLTNKTVFPTEAGREFPAEFTAIAKRIYLQMLTIFSHIYYAHFETLLHLKAESHFNSLSAHFLTFGLVHNFVDRECRELNKKSRKGVVMGSLLAAWSDLEIVKT